MKRVFTKHMGFSEGFAAAACGWGAMIETWQAQEDITILGFELAVWARDEQLIGNDGYASCAAYLLPVPSQYTDGILGMAIAHQDWNSVPAFGSFGCATRVVMFPDGYGATIREGESISLQSVFTNTSAATVGFNLRAVMYYVKGIRA